MVFQVSNHANEGAGSLEEVLLPMAKNDVNSRWLTEPGRDIGLVCLAAD